MLYGVTTIFFFCIIYFSNLRSFFYLGFLGKIYFNLSMLFKLFLSFLYLDNLREDFYRILHEIEAVTTQSEQQPSIYDSSKYESCIKIKGKPILPPLMTEEKKDQCFQWKKKAMEVENRLALKRQEKYSKSISNICENKKFSDTLNSIAPPSTLDSDINIKINTEERNLISVQDTGISSAPTSSALDIGLDENEIKQTRQRRLSYTLEEPSPVLLAYMQTLGGTIFIQTSQKS